MQSTIINILEGDIVNATYEILNSIRIAEKNSHGYLTIPSYNLYAYTLMLQKNKEAAITALKRDLLC